MLHIKVITSYILHVILRSLWTWTDFWKTYSYHSTHSTLCLKGCKKHFAAKKQQSNIINSLLNMHVEQCHAHSNDRWSNMTFEHQCKQMKRMYAQANGHRPAWRKQCVKKKKQILAIHVAIAAKRHHKN